MATVKQQMAVREVLKGSTIKDAMKAANYSPSAAGSTGVLTRSKGWAELTKKYLNDQELAKKHHEQLNASKLTKLYFDIDDDDDLIAEVCKKLDVELLFIKVNKDKTGKTVNVKAPDYFFSDLALDKAYKIKGRYMNEKEASGAKVLIINMLPDANSRYAKGLPSSPEGDSQGQTQV